MILWLGGGSSSRGVMGYLFGRWSIKLCILVILFVYWSIHVREGPKGNWGCNGSFREGGGVEREDPLRVESFFGENESTRKGVLVAFDGSMRKGVAISEKTGSLKEGFFHKLDKYL